MMQKSVQWRKSFGFHHGHWHCLCTCWRAPCQVPMGDKASASRDSLPRCLSWPCGSLGQPFLGSSHCVRPLATTVLPLCRACLCGSPQWQSRPPEQPLNENRGWVAKQVLLPKALGPITFKTQHFAAWSFRCRVDPETYLQLPWFSDLLSVPWDTPGAKQGQKAQPCPSAWLCCWKAPRNATSLPKAQQRLTFFTMNYLQTGCHSANIDQMASKRRSGKKYPQFWGRKRMPSGHPAGCEPWAGHHGGLQTACW